MLEALSKLEDSYSFSPSAGAQGPTMTMVTAVNGALSPGMTLMDLDISLENLGPDLMSAGPPGGYSLSLCEDSGTDDSLM